ncbi:MAG: hypothetical protein P1Q69_17165 [Candidatus Thorarchaeota archaeon]|nr:hypothetical protein [Candidatus Thorarchaeota archaeon]
MTEEPRFQLRRSAKLRTIKSLTPDTPNPVQIICIVVEAQPEAALVQDIMDEPDNQGSMIIAVNDQLSVAEKYILIGDVEMTSVPDGKELRLNVSYAYNVNSLDIRLYKQALKLEESIMTRV